jgi:transposase
VVLVADRGLLSVSNIEELGKLQTQLKKDGRDVALEYILAVPQRIRSHALVCFMALILYRVMRMRLKTANRSESPATLLEQLKRIHQQTVQTADGKTLTGLTELTPAQKSLFAALELALPTPSDLDKPVL